MALRNVCPFSSRKRFLENGLEPLENPLNGARLLTNRAFYGTVDSACKSCRSNANDGHEREIHMARKHRDLLFFETVRQEVLSVILGPRRILGLEVSGIVSFFCLSFSGFAGFQLSGIVWYFCLSI